jgi:hypothetical protein
LDVAEPESVCGALASEGRMIVCVRLPAVVTSRIEIWVETPERVADPSPARSTTSEPLEKPAARAGAAAEVGLTRGAPPMRRQRPKTPWEPPCAAWRICAKA